MVQTLVKLDSGNSKTGRMAVTYRTQDTCPTSCPLMAAGCYARGRIFGIPARLGKVDADGEYAAVRNLAMHLPPGGAFRANVSGDILGDDGRVDQGYVDALSAVATARPDVAAFTYTHAWRELTPDVAPGMTVNASCESAEDIAEAAAAGWATVVVDPGPDSPDTLIGSIVADRKVVQCPAQTHGKTCEECRLCARPERKSTVAFAVHGSGRKLAAASVKGART